MIARRQTFKSIAVPRKACRYCAAEIPSRSLKCVSCKAIQRFSFRMLTDIELISSIVAPASALVAVATYLATVLWPSYSATSFESAGNNFGTSYYIVRNSGNSDAQMIRAFTEIVAKAQNTNMDGLRKVLGGDMIAAAPMTTNLDLQSVKPGAKAIAVSIRDYTGLDKNIPKDEYHFVYMIDMIKRAILQYVESQNKNRSEIDIHLIETLVNLASYLVGVNDTEPDGKFDAQLDQMLTFKVVLSFSEYNGKRSTYEHEIRARPYAFRMASYINATSIENAGCKKIREAIKELERSKISLDRNRIYAGHCKPLDAPNH